MKELNLEEISRILAERENLPAAEVRIRLEEVLAFMLRALKSDERIEIRGLGSFRTRIRKPRWARNIRKGTSVFVPPHKSVVFLPGAALKKRQEVSEAPKIEMQPEKG